MAEMTAAEAIELCKRHETYADCFYHINRDDARRIAAIIEQQQQQIEQLKCCGNCNNCAYEPYDDECPACDLSGGLVDMTDKCDKWQGVE